MKINVFITLIIILCVWVLPAYGEQHKLSGEEIMWKVDRREDGDDQVSRARFTLVNRRGQKRIRDTVRHWKDYEGRDGLDTKTIIFFLEPPEVRDTGFLNWSYMDPDKDDDQWLYLPALRKVRRISASDKEDSFMGTDFTFDDMGDRLVEEDDHRLLKEETFQGRAHYVVESVPKQKDYIYSKKVSWVDKERWIVPEIEYYDRKGRRLKTLEVEWQLVDSVWTWKKAVMSNHQTGHHTEVDVSEVRINVGLEDDYFTEKAIRRGLR